MVTKTVLTITLLAAFSATAHAGSTISDKSYWPSEARQTAPLRAATQADVNSAFAYDRATSSLRSATNAFGGEAARPYLGGPKGR
jgi:hypothetical protein